MNSYLVVEYERVPARPPAVQVLLAADVRPARVQYSALATLDACKYNIYKQLCQLRDYDLTEIRRYSKAE